jgi:DNA-binding transcriptional ArsR family regulator
LDGVSSEPRLHRPADIAPVAALFVDPTRARIVMALVNHRALPASIIAGESGVSASTTSGHRGIGRHRAATAGELVA